MVTRFPSERKEVRVLVVDEAEDFFENVQDHAELNRHRYKIDCKLATRVTEVADIIKAWEPSVVVLDVANSPAKSAEIVKGCTQREVPVIVTGTSHSQEIEHTVEKIGAAAYFVKTEDPDALEEVIDLLATIAKEETTLH